jgi:hypothetical protein
MRRDSRRISARVSGLGERKKRTESFDLLVAPYGSKVLELAILKLAFDKTDRTLRQAGCIGWIVNRNKRVIVQPQPARPLKVATR